MYVGPVCALTIRLQDGAKGPTSTELKNQLICNAAKNYAGAISNMAAVDHIEKVIFFGSTE